MDPSLPSGATGYGLALFQSVLALAGVCVTAWAVLRWAARRGPMGSLTGGGRIRVLDRAMLDARRSVYLVQIGSRVLLLGGGEQSVTMLAELRADELPVETVSASPMGFAGVLSRLVGARPPPGPAD